MDTYILKKKALFTAVIDLVSSIITVNNAITMQCLRYTHAAVAPKPMFQRSALS